MKNNRDRLSPKMCSHNLQRVIFRTTKLHSLKSNAKYIFVENYKSQKESTLDSENTYQIWKNQSVMNLGYGAWRTLDSDWIGAGAQ